MPRGRVCVFMGYSETTTKQFRVYAPDLGYTTRSSVVVTKLAGVGVGDGVVSTGLGLVTEKGSARRLVSEAAVLDIYRRARVQLNSLPSLV